jgi:hypothetical protein
MPHHPVLVEGRGARLHFEGVCDLLHRLAFGQELQDFSLIDGERCLHAGHQSSETRSTEQTREDRAANNGLRVAGPNWTVKEGGDFAEVVCFVWRPRRDLNPCYRRERAVS